MVTIGLSEDVDALCIEHDYSLNAILTLNCHNDDTSIPTTSPTPEPTPMPSAETISPTAYPSASPTESALKHVALD